LRVTVTFIGGARGILGSREENLDVNAAVTVLEILRILATKHGSRMEAYLFDPESKDVRRHLRFLLNGQSTSSSTLITADSTIVIFPPVGGG